MIYINITYLFAHIVCTCGFIHLHIYIYICFYILLHPYLKTYSSSACCHRIGNINDHVLSFDTGCVAGAKCLGRYPSTVDRKGANRQRVQEVVFLCHTSMLKKPNLSKLDANFTQYSFFFGFGCWCWMIGIFTCSTLHIQNDIKWFFLMFLSNRTLQLQPNSGIWEKWASPQIGSTRMKKTGGCVFYVFFSRFFHGSFNWLNLPTPLCFTVFCLKTVLTRDQQSSCRTSDFVVLYGSGYSWVLFKPQRCKGW